MRARGPLVGPLHEDLAGARHAAGSERAAGVEALEVRVADLADRGCELVRVVDDAHRHPAGAVPALDHDGPSVGLEVCRGPGDADPHPLREQCHVELVEDVPEVDAGAHLAECGVRPPLRGQRQPRERGLRRVHVHRRCGQHLCPLAMGPMRIGDERRVEGKARSAQAVHPALHGSERSAVRGTQVDHVDAAPPQRGVELAERVRHVHVGDDDPRSRRGGARRHAPPSCVCAASRQPAIQARPATAHGGSPRGERPRSGRPAVLNGCSRPDTDRSVQQDSPAPVEDRRERPSSHGRQRGLLA